MNPQYFNELIELLLARQTKKDLAAFLKALLTPKELDELSKRVQIIKLLKQGVTQREISQQLGVGVATITRGSKELRKGGFTEIVTP